MRRGAMFSLTFALQLVTASETASTSPEQDGRMEGFGHFIGHIIENTL